MEIVKTEIEAIKEAAASADDQFTRELIDLQRAMIGGGTADVTFY